MKLWKLQKIDRSFLFAFVFIVTAVNGLNTKISESVSTLGFWEGALNLFGVSAVIWFALFAVHHIAISNTEREHQQALDLPIAVIALVTALLPVGMEASIALFLSAAYQFVTAVDHNRSRRISTVALAMTGYVLWGPALLNFLGPELVEFDAVLVAVFSGLPRDVNMIQFAGVQDSGIVISPGCSSVHNMSLALILFAAMTQIFNLKMTRRLMLVCAAAICATIMVNVVRLVSLAQFPDHFESLHHGFLSPIFGWASLLAIGSIIGMGVYRATGKAS